MSESQHTAHQAERAKFREMLRRIDEQLDVVKLSDRAASLRAGLSPAALRTMRRQYSEGSQYGVSHRTIAGLARALQTTPEYLLSGIKSEEEARGIAPGGSERGLPLAGVVAAGVWNEIGVESERMAPVPADPRYPAEYQSAYGVRGTSIDRVAQPSDYLIVVDRDKAGMPLRPGDLVIVTQVKEGGLREVTARRYRLDTVADTKLHTFRFESNDPRYSNMIVLPDDRDDHRGVQNSESVHFGGVVVAVYRPLA